MFESCDLLEASQFLPNGRKHPLLYCNKGLLNAVIKRDEGYRFLLSLRIILKDVHYLYINQIIRGRPLSLTELAARMPFLRNCTCAEDREMILN